jgi:hypothetical protein
MGAGGGEEEEEEASDQPLKGGSRSLTARCCCCCYYCYYCYSTAATEPFFVCAVYPNAQPRLLPLYKCIYTYIGLCDPSLLKLILLFLESHDCWAITAMVIVAFVLSSTATEYPHCALLTCPPLGASPAPRPASRVTGPFLPSEFGIGADQAGSAVAGYAGPARVSAKEGGIQTGSA